MFISQLYLNNQIKRYTNVANMVILPIFLVKKTEKRNTSVVVRRTCQNLILLIEK